MQRKIPIGFSLGQDQIEALKALALKEDRPMSYFMRAALDDYFKKVKRLGKPNRHSDPKLV